MWPPPSPPSSPLTDGDDAALSCGERADGAACCARESSHEREENKTRARGNFGFAFTTRGSRMRPRLPPQLTPQSDESRKAAGDETAARKRPIEQRDRRPPSVASRRRSPSAFNKMPATSSKVVTRERRAQKVQCNERTAAAMVLLSNLAGRVNERRVRSCRRATCR